MYAPAQACATSLPADVRTALQQRATLVSDTELLRDLARALREESLNGLSYRPQQQLRLRNLLFNNPHIASVRASDQSDDAMWSTWLQLMKENAGGLDNPDFGYLRDRFESFQDFALIVEFLQSSAIDGGSNKRWSSKLVFPFGTNALYEDASIQGQGASVSTDRRFFARTGEVLYLMHCRSSRVGELRDRLVNRLFAVKAPYDGLGKALQGDIQLAGLPEEQRSIWDAALRGLAASDDWTLHQVSNYVELTRSAVSDESKPILEALGWALPALHLPRHSGYFLAGQQKGLTSTGRWKNSRSKSVRPSDSVGQRRSWTALGWMPSTGSWVAWL